MDTSYDEGFYWVRFGDGKWSLAECNGIGWWLVLGDDIVYRVDMFMEIGPMIHHHQQLELPLLYPGNVGDYGV